MAADRSAHDIRNGIHRANFVKMNRLDGYTVNFGFSLSKYLESTESHVAGWSRNVRV